jgi:hypothetical protein
MPLESGSTNQENDPHKENAKTKPPESNHSEVGKKLQKNLPKKHEKRKKKND